MAHHYDDTPDDNDFHPVLTSPIMSGVQPYWYDHQKNKWFSIYDDREGLDSVYRWSDDTYDVDWLRPQPQLHTDKPHRSGFFKCGVEGYSHQEAYYNIDIDTWSCFGHTIENVNCWWYNDWWNGIKLADGRTIRMSELKYIMGNFFSDGIKILCKCHID